MRLTLALLPIVVCLVGCGSQTDAPPEDRALPEDTSLRGQWKVVRFERWGGPWNTDSSVGQTWEVTADRLACPANAPFAVEGTYRLRPSKRPKEIDIRTAEGKLVPGIYDVEGDALRLCVDQNGTRRPTAFASEGKSEIWLIALERVKPVVALSGQ